MSPVIHVLIFLKKCTLWCCSQVCGEIIGKACGWHYMQQRMVELFKGGISLERGDYSTYTFMEIHV